VANGFLFRAENTELASLEQLQARSSLVGRLAERTVIDDVPYIDVLQQVKMPVAPNPLRAELQMPLKRLVYEIRAGFKFGMDDGSEQ
jgi:hypothetical protein